MCTGYRLIYFWQVVILATITVTGTLHFVSGNDIDECRSCEHICVNTNGSQYCSCENGYFLTGDGHSCEDVDECLPGSKLNMCQQLCINTVGGHNCSCQEGYLLGEDGVSCSDFNECNTTNHGCAFECINTVGSFFCRDMPTFAANASYDQFVLLTVLGGVAFFILIALSVLGWIQNCCKRNGTEKETSDASGSKVKLPSLNIDAPVPIAEEPRTVSEHPDEMRDPSKPLAIADLGVADILRTTQGHRTYYNTPGQEHLDEDGYETPVDHRRALAGQTGSYIDMTGTALSRDTGYIDAAYPEILGNFEPPYKNVSALNVVQEVTHNRGDSDYERLRNQHRNDALESGNRYAELTH